MGRKSEGQDLPLELNNIPKFTVARLKEELTKLHQPISGTKSVLVERLLEAFQTNLDKSKTADISNTSPKDVGTQASSIKPQSPIKAHSPTKSDSPLKEAPVEDASKQNSPDKVLSQTRLLSTSLSPDKGYESPKSPMSPAKAALASPLKAEIPMKVTTAGLPSGPTSPPKVSPKSLTKPATPVKATTPASPSRLDSPAKLVPTSPAKPSSPIKKDINLEAKTVVLEKKRPLDSPVSPSKKQKLEEGQ
jgi:hypothetical protein